MKPDWPALFFSSIGVILAIIAWAIFAPLSLGGGTGYVLITGNSMEPEFQTGDLVLVRPAASYQVGQAVTYFSADLQRYVFHRIIAEESGRFTLRGDHNTWDDPYHPDSSEIIGAYWLRVPGAGKLIEKMRQPWAAVLLVLVAGGLIATMFIRTKKDEKQPGSTGKTIQQRWVDWITPRLKPSKAVVVRHPAEPAGNFDSQLPGWFTGLVEPALFILGFITLASLILGFFAYLNPAQIEKTEYLPYQQVGVFSYGAQAPAGLYDAQQIQSGAPVFTKINCAVDIQYTYLLSAQDLGPVKGTAQLTAELSDPGSGWKRSFLLSQPAEFSEPTFTTSGKLDFCRMQAVAAEMETQTGVSPNFYIVTVRPEARVEGTLSGLPFTPEFQPELRFQLDRLHAFVLRENEETDPLRPSQEGLFEFRYPAANQLKAFGLAIDVPKARILSLIGLAISLGLLALLAWLVNRAARQNPAALYKMKYGAMLVDVQAGRSPASQRAIDVASMDDLARLAERSNAVILHEASGSQHIYSVEGQQLTYRYSEQTGAGLEQPRELANWLNLKRAVDRGEFKVFYQPIVSLSDEKITAVEALLRWQHPRSGLISARDFIAAAESTGMIDTIGEWMLGTACAQVNQWRNAGHDIRLAVNFSRRQLEHAPEEIIERVLRQSGMEASALQIEIPAADVMRSPDELLPSLRRLKALGVHLSMDGYAGEESLNTIAELPLDSIKIDRLVIERYHQPEDAEYIGGLITAAMNKGLNVVAEGVETESQMDFLRSRLCTQAQGYLFARPAPAEEISLLLAGSEPVHPNGE